MNLFTKQKQTHTLREQTHGSQLGKMRGRDSQGVWDVLLSLKWITNKDLAQGTLLSIMWPPEWEGRMHPRICIADSLCC